MFIGALDNPFVVFTFRGDYNGVFSNSIVCSGTLNHSVLRHHKIRCSVTTNSIRCSVTTKIRSSVSKTISELRLQTLEKKYQIEIRYYSGRCVDVSDVNKQLLLLRTGYPVWGGDFSYVGPRRSYSALSKAASDDFMRSMMGIKSEHGQGFFLRCCPSSCAYLRGGTKGSPGDAFFRGSVRPIVSWGSYLSIEINRASPPNQFLIASPRS